ncbi:hypothetical protein E6H32_06720 [Candidatus Bathyarchaeota archaeon]|nr:MAG: hypothetical protein E6H32_06720 [Candidatus Bathyarchaeota archaeon]
MPGSQHERLKIAVDLDGVLAETMEAWCKRANEFLGTSFKLADLDTWASWRKLGISREQFFQFLDEAWDDWESIPPTEPRLAEKVRKIARSGQIDVVTGRSKESVSAAKSWLAEHKIPYRRFVRVPGWKDKIFLNYDVYIDDAPELMPLISRNPKMWGILYSRPWNRTVPELRQVFRVESWTEISKLLEQIRR